MKYIRYGVLEIAIIVLSLTLTAGFSEAQTLGSLHSSTDLKEVRIEKGMDLKEAAEHLEEKFNVVLLYQTDTMKGKKVSGTMVLPDNVKRALGKLLKGQNLQFKHLNPKTYGVFAPGQSPVNKQVNSIPEVVTGTITDGESGETLPGVNIQVKGTTTGTSTGANGNYELTVESLQDTLLFSFIGYQQQSVPINGRTEINIEMQPQVFTGEEMVVVGYGQQQRENLTGSVSSVNSEDLEEISVSRVDNALTGQFAGVNIQQTNPAAGEAPEIRVRGQGSLSFDSDPLIVVDGIAVGNRADYLSSLNTNNVESVEVLKDASSAAIYGSRGANGVVLITTKDGQSGPTRFSYSGYVGLNSVPETDLFSSPDEWAEYVRANNNGQLTERMQYIDRIGNYTDWEDVMFPGGSIMNHSITASGGDDQTTFLVAVSYLDDEGVLLTNNYNKLNFRINLDTKLSDNLEFGLRLNPSRTETRQFPVGVHNALRDGSWLPTHLNENNIQYVNRHRANGRWADAEVGDYATERMFDNYNLGTGEPTSDGTGTNISITSGLSPLGEVMEFKQKNYQTNIYGNSYLAYTVLDNLEFKQTLGFDFRYIRDTFFEGIIESASVEGGTSSSRNTFNSLHYVSESTLNYNNDFEDHSVNVIGGVSYEHWNREFSNLAASGNKNNLITTITEPNLIGGNTFEAEENLLSFFSRVNYDYNDKYLLSISARADGSSKFGPNNKFGFFPAGSVGWRVSQEPFFDNVPVVDDFKIRFSYGETGNNNGIGEYSHKSLLSAVGTGFGSVGYNVQNIANPNLEWEKLVEINPGIDISFLSRKVDISFDYYRRVSKNLLLNLPVPGVTGFNTELVNNGEVENEGIELEVSTRNISNSNFSWNTSILLTHNKNTLTDFAGTSEEISVIDPKRPAEWIAREGLPISSFYGYVADREIDPEFIIDPFYPIDAKSKDIYVRDLNGDGVITTADRTYLGSPYPDITWSLQNSFSYKNITLSFMFNGSHGAEVRNMSRQYLEQHFSPLKDYVTGFEDADLVRERIFTDDIIQSASYVALRNLRLSYNLPDSYLTKLGIQNGKVYFSGQNLMYIMADDYEGHNPEGISDSRLESVADTPLTYGYQLGPAPIYRTASLGINIEF